MMAGLVLDGLLALLVLAVAAWTIGVCQTFAATVGFTVYGLLLAVVWMRLAAPDAALTEAAIGALTGVLLLRAAIQLAPSEAGLNRLRPALKLRLLAGTLAFAITATLAAVVFHLPEPAPTLVPQVAAQQASTGLGNAVTAVLLAFRAIDTLLEAVVLIFALVAVWSLAPDAAWGGIPGAQIKGGSGDVRAYLSRLLPPVGIVIAFYIFWVGADFPGGKFQAGTLLAAMGLLATMAGLIQPPPVASRGLRWALVLGTLVFLAVGLAGMPLAGAFLAYPEGWAKPLILLIEAASMLSIGVTLGLLVIGYPAGQAEQ